MITQVDWEPNTRTVKVKVVHKPGDYTVFELTERQAALLADKLIEGAAKREEKKYRKTKLKKVVAK